MNQQSVRERINTLILELEEYEKLSPRKQKQGKNKLKERVDREIRDCTSALLDLPKWEYNYLLDRLIKLLMSIGLVVAVFPRIH